MASGGDANVHMLECPPSQAGDTAYRTTDMTLAGLGVQNLVAADWTAGESSYDELNPSTGDVLLTAPLSGRESVAAAVAAARRALPGWRSKPDPARGELLERAAANVEAAADELARSMVEEVGKPLREARAEVARTAAILRYFGGEGRRAGGEVIPSDTGGLTFTVRRPVGVAALVTPWNFPLAIPAWKLGPALVAGNTVVLKPAEQASRMAAQLARCLLDAGLPAGVLNVVCGDGGAGALLVDHPEVDAISFTGSATAGAAVRRAAAARGVRAQVEMGGKNGAVVLADAELTQAAGFVAAGAFSFAGQKCTATGLCLVEHSVHDAFLDAVENARSRVRVGDPTDDTTVCGPMIEPAAAERAVAAGARRLPGRGNFVEPTLLTGIDLDDARATDELFAPVLPVIAVDGLDDALAILNALPTGLSAGLHTRSAAASLRFLREAGAGVIAIGKPTTGLEVQAPFGGIKASGSEHKEMGTHAVDFYTDVSTVYWSAS